MSAALTLEDFPVEDRPRKAAELRRNIDAKCAEYDRRRLALDTLGREIEQLVGLLPPEGESL